MVYFRVPLFARWIFFRRIWSINSKDTVYLTFDDGPTESLCPWILDFLQAEQVPATFFCVGENVQRQPDLIKRILEEGHAVGNHTMKHERGTKTRTHHYIQSIHSTANVLDTKLFRPPYGRVNMLQTRQIRREFNIVMWTWLSYDFDPKVSLETILNSARSSIKAGDILLLHDNERVAERTRELLPELIAIVRQKGLKFGIISV